MSRELASLIERRRKAQRLTLTAIAELVGVSYPAVQQWSSGKTNPARGKVNKLAEILQINPEEIIKIIDKDDATRELLRPRTLDEEAYFKPIDDKYKMWREEADKLEIPVHDYIAQQEANERYEKYMSTRNWSDLPQKGADESTKLIPVLGASPTKSFNTYDFSFDWYVGNYLDRPVGLSYAKNAYAFYVCSSNMVPRFEIGELLFVNPDRVAAVNDFVVVEDTLDLNGHGTRCYLRRLIERNDSQIKIGQYSPASELIISLDDVKAIHRIAPVRELIGV